MQVQRVVIFIIAICSLFACKNDETDPGNLVLLQMLVGSDEVNIGGAISEGMAVDRSITLVFSHAVDQTSAINSISLQNASQTIPVNFNFLSQDKNTIISPIGALSSNTIYTLTISSQLRGAGGQNFQSLTVSFKTILGQLTILSLEVGGVESVDESRVINTPLDLAMIMEFSAPVDPVSFEDALRLTGPDIPAMSVTFLNDNRTVNVSGASQLPYLSKYELQLSSALQGAEGENFGGHQLVFFTKLDSTLKFPVISQDALLTKVQEQTFRYFWDFAHPVSGLIRERNTSGELVTSGGSGFGLMAIIVGIERGFITRTEGITRLDKIISFLGMNASRFHGAWSHWLNGTTGAVIPFSPDDDGGDLVETAFMAQGLITVRQYLDTNEASEAALIDKINGLWEAIEWDWYTQEGQNVLYWHWSPNFGWQKNHQISGYNEALIVYILAAGSPSFPIDPEVYHQGWARNGSIINGNQYLGITLPLGFDFGGPLFFSHYSFLGLDPRNLSDQYGDYWQQNVNHSLINRQWCIDNPKRFVGYSTQCWGLTASDNHQGYSAHSPSNDLGVITPTAAISSLPYTPSHSMEALEHFYYLLGDRIWGPYGFYDAFNFNENWEADSYLAIDQGPIVIMIENHRTGLLWDLFMSAPEVQNGLVKLGFTF